ncbi:transketolase [Candidatus Shapirobacteria bacterium CG03_land_8_20_14_0_80_39_12]|uniref:Transketolase n=1 Tax=Candidatus Shapirobacteria bacterium CG03_land_8_20_14_0_80_39_12 TaxID=1974879 RepID=A0A2M7BBR9_9BACT|nr:MAG: transketolase [Candidatus Shapirobacteria bacterium CG03_land_8_20_14_0_80_39_12]
MEKSMRDAFGEAILQLGKTNPKVLALTADVEPSVRLTDFAREFPERFFNVGVAEANMIGIAAGLALEGFIPFCTSFAVFVPGRCFDHLRVSVCQNKANVKLVGSHCGFSNAGDGASAQSVEDMALMLSLPEMTVVCPADGVETRKAVLAAAKKEGPVYLRLSRAETPFITKEGDNFEIGRASILRKGKKVTIIACGSLVAEALVAAEKINAEVINLSTIKPLDEETILSSVKKTGRVITLEEHSVIGGIGSTIAGFLGEKFPLPIKIMGIPDVFGESARNYQELLDKYGLNAENIIKEFEKI